MSMTSAERVGIALSHREPDRVPLLLPLTLHGARELGLTIREYFARPAAVAEGQLRMQSRYGQDFLVGFFYASLELEAWGGGTIFVQDGPPNAAAPLVREAEGIRSLSPPRLENSPGLLRVLETIGLMKARRPSVPILGVAVAPFSLPIMQLGFELYLQVLHERPDLVDILLRVDEEFCVQWANAQLRAGASAVCLFDPCASPTVTPPELSRRAGFPSERRTLARIQGPVATHFASGRCSGVLDDLGATGTVGIGVSALDDLRAIKAACRGRLAVIGNLNGLAMPDWGPASAEAAVRRALAAAAPGGGFILSDNHGEIPWQVPEEVLSSIADAARRWGTYPLAWAEAGAGES